MWSVVGGYRKFSVNLYSRLGIPSMADVVRRGRLRWFVHLERRRLDDWMSAFRKVARARYRGRNRKP